MIANYDLVPPATTASVAWYKNGAPLCAFFMPVEGGQSVAILDYSGNALPTTPQDVPTFVPGGGNDGLGALLLDGVDDAVTVPDAAALDVDHVTLAAWIKVSSFGDDSRLISKEFGTVQPYSIYTLNMGTAGTFVTGEDHIQFRIGLEGQNRILLESQQAVPLDTWTHVAGTFDGSTMRIFINGVADTSLAATGVLRKNDEPLVIGNSSFYARNFDGAMDDVRVYPEALDPDQVATLFSGDPHINEGGTTNGDDWHFSVTPFGAGVDGTPVVSNSVVIGNALPLAMDDTVTVASGDSADVDVLANDSDSDGTVDSTSVTVLTPPSHGSYEVNPATGVIRYWHNGTGNADSLSYTVKDNTGAVSAAAMLRITIDIVSGVDDTPGLPRTFALYQNVPNPFNPTTAIRFDVPAGGARVTLDVYDVTGRLVTRLVDGHQSGGRKSVTWDGHNRRGQRVASGVYFYRLKAGSFNATRKMVVVQ